MMLYPSHLTMKKNGQTYHGIINLKSVLEKEPGLLHFGEFTRGLLAKEDNSRNTTLGI